MLQTQSKLKSRKKRRLASVWLLASLIVTLLAFTLWIFSASASAIENEEEKTEDEQIEVENSLLNEVSLTGQITNLDELTSSVAPISFDDIIIDMRDYPAEFKDKKYLMARQGKWTIQVMNVSDHNIIKDYLQTREDRSDFAYFRYIDDFKKTRYLLVYGVMGTEEKINSLLDKVDFALPKGVSVKPIKFSDYLNKVENYERADSIVAITSKQPREVKLKPTNRELAARTAPPKIKNSTNAVSDGHSGVNNSDWTATGIQSFEEYNNLQNLQQQQKANVNEPVRSTDIQKTNNVPKTKTPVKNNESKTRAKNKETYKPYSPIADSPNSNTNNAGSQPKQFNPDDVKQ